MRPRRRARSGSSFMTARQSTDLPQPDSPTTARISPGCSARETPRHRMQRARRRVEIHFQILYLKNRFLRCFAVHPLTRTCHDRRFRPKISLNADGSAAKNLSPRPEASRSGVPEAAQKDDPPRRLRMSPVSAKSNAGLALQRPVLNIPHDARRMMPEHPRNIQATQSFHRHVVARPDRRRTDAPDASRTPLQTRPVNAPALVLVQRPAALAKQTVHFGVGIVAWCCRSRRSQSP